MKRMALIAPASHRGHMRKSGTIDVRVRLNRAQRERSSRSHRMANRFRTLSTTVGQSDQIKTVRQAGLLQQHQFLRTQPIRQPSPDLKMIFIAENRSPQMRTRSCVWVNEQDIVVSPGEVNNPKTEIIRSLFDGLDADVTIGIH